MTVINPEVAEENGKTVVYLPVCRRIAGEVVCEEKGIKVSYVKGSKPVLEEVEIKYPRVEEGEGVIVVTAKYRRGVIGPIEVKRRIE